MLDAAVEVRDVARPHGFHARPGLALAEQRGLGGGEREIERVPVLVDLLAVLEQHHQQHLRGEHLVRAAHELLHARPVARVVGEIARQEGVLLVEAQQHQRQPAPGARVDPADPGEHRDQQEGRHELEQVGHVVARVLPDRERHGHGGPGEGEPEIVHGLRQQRRVPRPAARRAARAEARAGRAQAAGAERPGRRQQRDREVGAVDARELHELHPCHRPLLQGADRDRAREQRVVEEVGTAPVHQREAREHRGGEARAERQRARRRHVEEGVEAHDRHAEDEVLLGVEREQPAGAGHDQRAHAEAPRPRHHHRQREQEDAQRVRARHRGRVEHQPGIDRERGGRGEQRAARSAPGRVPEHRAAEHDEQRRDRAVQHQVVGEDVRERRHQDVVERRIDVGGLRLVRRGVGVGAARDDAGDQRHRALVQVERDRHRHDGPVMPQQQRAEHGEREDQRGARGAHAPASGRRSSSV